MTNPPSTFKKTRPQHILVHETHPTPVLVCLCGILLEEFFFSPVISIFLTSIPHAPRWRGKHLFSRSTSCLVFYYTLTAFFLAFFTAHAYIRDHLYNIIHLLHFHVVLTTSCPLRVCFALSCEKEYIYEAHALRPLIVLRDM